MLGIRWLVCCAALWLGTGLVQAQSGLKPPSAKPRPAAKAGEESPGERAVEEIFRCLATGLPADWRRAWVVVTELESDGKERRFEGKFYYSLDAAGAKPATLAPCDAREAAQGVYRLNDFLEPEKRQWKVATLVFLREGGKFELKYDYAR